MCGPSLLRGASHFLPGLLRNVPSANQHTHTGSVFHPLWLVIIVMDDAKNVVQLRMLACNVNTTDKRGDACRLGSAAQRSSLCWTMASSTAINPVTPPPPHGVRFCSVDFFIKVQEISPDIKRSLSLRGGVCPRSPFYHQFFAKNFSSQILGNNVRQVLSKEGL